MNTELKKQEQLTERAEPVVHLSSKVLRRPERKFYYQSDVMSSYSKWT